MATNNIDKEYKNCTINCFSFRKMAHKIDKVDRYVQVTIRLSGLTYYSRYNDICRSTQIIVNIDLYVKPHNLGSCEGLSLSACWRGASEPWPLSMYVKLLHLILAYGLLQGFTQ